MDCEGVDEVFDFLITCSMNPETVVTITHNSFNQVVFAVNYIYIYLLYI